MSTVSIEQLRAKYRKIIERQPSQNSSDEDRNSLSFKKTTNHMRVLTQHCENTSYRKANDPKSSAVLIALKQRIAQGIQNLSQKDRQIQNYKQEIIKHKLQISMLQSQLAEYKITTQQKCNKIAQEKVNATVLQKQIQNLKQIIQDQYIDKELVYKQIQFYKKQIKDLKHQKKKIGTVLQKIQKESQTFQRIKSNNNRLNQNIKRMQKIINQCCQQKVGGVDLTNKYYLGKPQKQSSYWYSQNLVGSVQNFLRKWQIGFNNKDFTDSLVKFIDGQRSNKKQISGNKNRQAKSANKRSSCKANFSFNDVFTDISAANKSIIQNSLKKSILVNKYKKKHNKLCTEPLFEDEKPIKGQNFYNIMFNEYQSALTEVLKQKQIKPNKILQLSEQFKANVTSYLEQTKAIINK